MFGVTGVPFRVRLECKILMEISFSTPFAPQLNEVDTELEKYFIKFFCFLSLK